MTTLERTGLHHVEDVMGTVVSIDLRDEWVELDAIEEVVAWLHHVDDTFSPYKQDSPITAIGRGELAYVDAGDEIQNVLRACETLRIATDGVFDVFAVPSPNGTTFDPCGFVKGWSIELAAHILEGRGAENFCINAGGDVRVAGRPSSGSTWSIGIQDPSERQRIAMVVAGVGPLAVATSATYARGAHIIDPRTAQPTTSIASATVVGPDLMLADAYATTVFVMGIEGVAWIEHRSGYESFVIDHAGTSHQSSGFLGWTRGG